MVITTNALLTKMLGFDGIGDQESLNEHKLICGKRKRVLLELISSARAQVRELYGSRIKAAKTLALEVAKAAEGKCKGKQAMTKEWGRNKADSNL